MGVMPFAEQLTPLHQSKPEYLRVLNASGEIIPSYAVLEIVSWDASNNLYTVRKPTRSGSTDVIFNDSTPIPAGLSGQALRGFPARVAFARDTTGIDPASATEIPFSSTTYGTNDKQIWGVLSGSWYLSPNTSGFMVADGTDAVRGTLLVKPMRAALTDWVQITYDYSLWGPPATNYYAGCLMRFDPATNDVVADTSRRVWVRFQGDQVEPVPGDRFPGWLMGGKAEVDTTPLITEQSRRQVFYVPIQEESCTDYQTRVTDFGDGANTSEPYYGTWGCTVSLMNGASTEFLVKNTMLKVPGHNRTVDIWGQLYGLLRVIDRTFAGAQQDYLSFVVSGAIAQITSAGVYVQRATPYKRMFSGQIHKFKINLSNIYDVMPFFATGDLVYPQSPLNNESRTDPPPPPPSVTALPNEEPVMFGGETSFDTRINIAPSSGAPTTGGTDYSGLDKYYCWIVRVHSHSNATAATGTLSLGLSDGTSSLRYKRVYAQGCDHQAFSVTCPTNPTGSIGSDGSIGSTGSIGGGSTSPPPPPDDCCTTELAAHPDLTVNIDGSFHTATWDGSTGWAFTANGVDGLITCGSKVGSLGPWIVHATGSISSYYCVSAACGPMVAIWSAAAAAEFGGGSMYAEHV